MALYALFFHLAHHKSTFFPQRFVADAVYIFTIDMKRFINQNMQYLENHLPFFYLRRVPLQILERVPPARLITFNAIFIL